MDRSVFITLVLLLAQTAGAAEIQGKYIPLSEIAPNDYSRLANGCEKPGDPRSGSVPGVNPSFVTGLKISDLSQDLTTKSRTVLTVNGVSQSGYDVDVAYIEASGIAGIQAGTKINEKWQMKVAKAGDTVVFAGKTLHPVVGNTYFDVKSIPENMSRFNITRARGCMALGGGTVTERSSTVGTFILAKTGQKIKAYRRSSTQTNVKILCYDGSPTDAVDEGLGEFSRTVISSNDIPSETNKCGGASVFVYEKAVNSKGVVLEDSSYEILGFKQ